MINEYELAFTATQWAIVQNELPFYASDSNGTRRGNDASTSGGYAGDDYVWINNGNSVVVYHVSSLREVANWTVESGAVIAFVCVYNSHASDRALLLAVNGANSNAVLALDILSNTVARLFTVPDEIVCLEPIRWPGQNSRIWEDCRQPVFAQSQFIIAVSTTQGHVYTFGKRMCEREVPKSRRSSIWSMSASSDESKNGWTKLTDLIGAFRVVDDDTNVEYLRFVAYENSQDRFAGKYGMSKDGFCCKADSSLCSALLFSQQTMILVIGFNFGCVLLYHVLIGAFSFVGSVPEDGREVTNFCFVQPEENPRNVIYLIVSKYGQLLSGYFGAEIQVVDLQFVHKRQLEDGNNVYSDFVGMRESFSMRVEDCEKFLVRTTKRKEFHEEGEADGFSPSVYFLGSSADGDVFAFFFDVNSWYHVQTPASISTGYLGHCQFMNMHRYGKISMVLDVMVSPFVTVEHRHLLEPDFIYYPCNYSMSVQLLTSKGLVNCIFESLQESTFARLEADPSAFADPHRGLEELQRAGLIERTPSMLLYNEKDKMLRIWACMLSAKRLNYFLNFLNLQIIEPSVVKLLKNWAWQCSIRTKRVVQQIAMDHLDYGNEMVPDLYRRLCSHQQSIEILVTLHGCLIDAGLAFYEKDKARYEAMVLISLYVHVVAWFLRQQSQLFASIDSCSHIVHSNASSLRNPSSLFVKGFTELLKSEMEGCLPNIVFPPATLEQLLRIYLLPFLDLRTKHFAVFYVLLEKLLHCECNSSIHQVEQLVNLFERQILDETDPSLAKYAWYSILTDHEEDKQAESWLLRAVMCSSSASFNFWKKFLSHFKYKLPLPQLLLTSRLEQTDNVPFRETFSNSLDGNGWLLAMPFTCGTTVENTMGLRLPSCSTMAPRNQTGVEEIPPANQLVGRMPAVEDARYADFKATNRSRCTDATLADAAHNQTDTTVTRCFAVVNALKERVGYLLPEIGYVAPDVTYGLTKRDGSQLVPSDVARMRQNRKRCAALLDVANSSFSMRLDGNDVSSPMMKRKKTDVSSDATSLGTMRSKQRRMSLPFECWADRKSLVDLRHHRDFWDALLTFSRPRTHRPVSLISPTSLTPVLTRRCASDDRPSSSRSAGKRVRFNLANEIDGALPRHKPMHSPLLPPFRQTRSRSQIVRNIETSSDQDGDEDFSVYADIRREIRSSNSSVQSKPRFPPISASEIKPVDSATILPERDVLSAVEDASGFSNYSSSIPERQNSKDRSTISVAPQHAVETPEERVAVQSNQIEEQSVSSVKPLSHSNSRSESANKELLVKKTKLRGASKRKASTVSNNISEEAVPTRSEETRNGSARYYLRSLKKRRSLNEDQPGRSSR